LAGRHAPEGLPRLLLGMRDDRRPPTLREHEDRHGDLQAALRGRQLIDAVAACGLTGRGGASFPTGAKLQAVAESGRRSVVLVNAAEEEPTSAKDRALLNTTPQLVLDGAVLAAQAVGATQVFVAIGRGDALTNSVVRGAIDERLRAKANGRVRFEFVALPSGFVVGEETALINFINGRAAKPSFTPPRPHERGIKGRPTLVQNVETLAHIALIARYGARWFRELGTETEPGSTLATISGAVRRPGVHELAMGTPFAAAVEEAGGLAEPVSAVLVGGYFGTWVSAETALQLRLLDGDLPAGATLGARAIVAMPADACALGEVARATRYLARESAGQCGPCVHGLAAIADGMERLTAGTGDDRKRLARWVDVVRGRGACHHPDGATRFVASALDVFADEVATHLRYGRCRGRIRGVLRVPHQT
jgi:NADH:ubiquinone oxidoreductase subunit F (NADH-binding)